MKRLALIILAIVALAWLAFNPQTASQAGATTNPPYSAFGNNPGPNQIGDCVYETMANLELHEFPTAVITTNEVVRAYRAGLDPQVMNFMSTTGFDGYTVASVTQITTKAQIIAAAAAGGVWSSMMDDSHAVALIAADARYVTVVDDGNIEHWTWSTYRYWQGNDRWDYAIVWNPTQGAVSQ